jgi:hypothetical protein
VSRARDPEVTSALIAVCQQISTLLGYSTERASSARSGV